jgi:hypothetical protein
LHSRCACPHAAVSGCFVHGINPCTHLLAQPEAHRHLVALCCCCTLSHSRIAGTAHCHSRSSWQQGAGSNRWCWSVNVGSNDQTVGHLDRPLSGSAPSSNAVDSTLGPVCVQGPLRQHGALTLIRWGSGKCLDSLVGRGRAYARSRLPRSHCTEIETEATETSKAGNEAAQKGTCKQ